MLDDVNMSKIMDIVYLIVITSLYMVGFHHNVFYCAFNTGS